MKKTGQHLWSDAVDIYTETLTCESVGKTPYGKTIWKEVGDAHECYLFVGGLFRRYDPDRYDDLNELYGTYLDEDGNRVEYELPSLAQLQTKGKK